MLPPKARGVTCQHENHGCDYTEGDKRLEISSGTFQESPIQSPRQFLLSPCVLCKVTRDWLGWVTSQKSGQDCHAAGCRYVIRLGKYGPIGSSSKGCVSKSCRPEDSGNVCHLAQLQGSESGIKCHFRCPVLSETPARGWWIGGRTSVRPVSLRGNEKPSEEHQDISKGMRCLYLGTRVPSYIFTPSMSPSELLTLSCFLQSV